MKSIIIVSDSRHIPKIRNFLQDATVIATNLEVEKDLQEEGINFKPAQNYIKLKSTRHYILKGKKFILDWINKNQNFNSLLCYDNIPLLDLLKFNLIEGSDYYYALEEIMRAVDLFEVILKKEKPDRIIAVEDGNPTTEILKKISNPLLIKSKNSFSYYKKNILTPLLAHFLLKFKIHYRGKIKKCHLEDFQGKIITLAAGYNYITPILPLIKDMKDDFLIIKPLQLRTNNVVKLLKKENISFLPIESFLDKNLIHLVKSNTKKIIKNLDILMKNKDFISSFEYKGVPIFNVFKKTLNCLFKRRGKILESILNIELNKKILKSLNPKLILLLEEDNLHSLAILRLAKEQKTPTLHMQHGFLSKIMVKEAYLSDKILVWGSAFKEGILKYKKDKDVLVTGRLIKKDYNKKLILDKLNIPENKKIITFATNKVTDKELILEILNITKKLEDVQLVIKLHPSENGKLQKKLTKLTKTNPIIIKNIDIDELMYISDLVIVKYSTVGLLALGHCKPLISVDCERFDNEFDYIKSGAAVGINKLKDLRRAITNLLYNKQKKKKLLEKAKLYATKYLVGDSDPLKKTKDIIKEMIS